MILGRIEYKIGSRVEISADDGGDPYAATITNIRENMYVIHYDGCEEDDRVWVPREKVCGWLQVASNN